MIRCTLTLLLITFCSFKCLSQTIEQLQQQLISAQTEGDINAEVKATINLAKHYEKQKNYEQAIIHYKTGLSIFEKNNQKENTAVCFASIGNAFFKNTKYNESINWNNKAIKLFDQLNDQKNLAYTLMLNGDNYAKLKLTEKAIQFYEKSSSVYALINDKKSEAIVLNKIGTTYSSYGNYDKALLFLNKAYKIATSTNNMPTELALINGNIDVVKKNSKNLEGAKTDFVKEAEKQKEQLIIGLNTKNIKSLEEIEKLRIEAQVKELKIKAQQEQLLLKQLEADKQKQEKEFLIKEKEYERLKAEAKIFKQQLIIIGTSILALLLFIITIIVYKYYKEKKQANVLLELKNKEILEQGEKIKNQAVEIARYQSQMNPHFIFNAINGFQNSILEGNKEETLMQIQSFAKLLRQTLNNAENEYISLNDEIAYLNKYIEFELHRFSKKFKFSITCDKTVSLETKIPTMLIQPLLENAIKHAGLNNIDNGEIIVTINKNKTFPNQALTITVTDNGVGIIKNNNKKENVSKGTAITKHRILLEIQKTNMPLVNYFTIISPLNSDISGGGTSSIIDVPYNL